MPRARRASLFRTLLPILLATTLSATDAASCGAESDCVVGDRTYRILLPDPRPEGSVGAIVYVHGYRGKAERVMRNKALSGLADRLGVAVIAAQAKTVEWNVPGVPSGEVPPETDELGYFEALAADAAARFGLDRSRFLVAGFSSGAMMVWDLACRRGDAFAGFAPMSGAFWRPVPENCPAGAVNLIHYHGRQDPIVPMEGRAIKDARQGDVGEAMALMTRVGGYGPPVKTVEGELACERRTNLEGNLLELCLFDGKHGMKVDNIARAWAEISVARGW